MIENEVEQPFEKNQSIKEFIKFGIIHNIKYLDLHIGIYKTEIRGGC